jgi:hypothetical protein
LKSFIRQQIAQPTSISSFHYRYFSSIAAGHIRFKKVSSESGTQTTSPIYYIFYIYIVFDSLIPYRLMQPYARCKQDSPNYKVTMNIAPAIGRRTFKKMNKINKPRFTRHQSNMFMSSYRTAFYVGRLELISLSNSPTYTAL